MSNPKLVWNRQLKEKDLEAASIYLSLLCRSTEVRRIIKDFRRATARPFAAKDILRASRLELLPKKESRVSGDLKRICKGKPLAPVFLVSGDTTRDVPLTIADGYHRVCAVCYFDENEPVPCLLVHL